MRELVLDGVARVVAAGRELLTELRERVEEEHARSVARQANESAPGIATADTARRASATRREAR